MSTQLNIEFRKVIALLLRVNCHHNTTACLPDIITEIITKLQCLWLKAFTMFWIQSSWWIKVPSSPNALDTASDKAQIGCIYNTHHKLPVDRIIYLLNRCTNNWKWNLLWWNPDFIVHLPSIIFKFQMIDIYPWGEFLAGTFFHFIINRFLLRLGFRQCAQ